MEKTLTPPSSARGKKKEEEQKLPPVQKGEERRTEKTKLLKKKTTPPLPYTESSLLSAMENAGRFVEDEALREQMKDSGLGTPATRAAIIERLLTVGYIVRKGKTLLPTEKGRKLIEIVPDEMCSPQTTGKWEKGLSSIAKGKMSEERFMESIRRYVRFLVQDAASGRKAGVVFPEENRRGKGRKTNSFGKCPLCGRDVLENTKAFYCAGWKGGCKFTLWKDCLKPYGVELDESRAEEAQTRLHRVGFGSYFYSRISGEAFHLLFLNPPYLSVLNENGGRSRHEKRFLMESLYHLAYGGLLVYVIPCYRLTPDICRVLCDNFDDLTVWRFTAREFKRFKQIAVLGTRKRRDAGPPDTLWLERYAVTPEAIPCLTELPEDRYALPVQPLEVHTFMGERFNQKELEQQLRRSGSFARMMARSELDSGAKRPLLPLSIGQIGLVGGSGMINGLIACDSPHVIKGRIVKTVCVESEDRLTADGRHIGVIEKEVISNKMIFSVLTPKGFRALL